jgi:hypothetical protein
VLDRLFPLAGLGPADAEHHVATERLVGDLQVVQADVARRYLDGELEFARAVSALEERALVPHAEALIKYVNQYRSYVTTYTAGRIVIAARLAACSGASPTEDARWRCFEEETVTSSRAARRSGNGRIHVGLNFSAIERAIIDSHLVDQALEVFAPY